MANTSLSRLGRRLFLRAIRDPKTTATAVAAIVCLVCTNVDHDKVLAAAVFLIGLFSADSNKEAQ